MSWRILVVDDDPSMRAALEKTLQRAGHTVTLAANGAAALRLVEHSTFDLLVTDLVMPEVEGLQLLREIGTKQAGLKVIAMSGGGRGSAGSYLALATMLGAAATLEKPFTPQVLTETIGRVMEGKVSA